jgi:RNA polymerase sigma factor (TIGR02999 family)
MKANAQTQAPMRLGCTTLIIIAAIVVFAGLCLLGLFLHLSHPPADTMRWLTYCGIGAAVIVVLVVILQDVHETRATRRVVAEALEGRARMTGEEFGSRFYEPAIAPVATQLRRLLAENLDCDLAGMTPADNFEEWLDTPLYGCYTISMSSVTRILNHMRSGELKSANELLPLVYDDLRRLAAQKMAQEPPGQTLQATALVHEAWLRVAGSDGKPWEWEGRRHFFAAAAEAMRRILIENARRKRQLKRGGQLQRVDLDGLDLPAPMADDELLALDEALTQLAQINPEAVELVKLCFFVGLTQEQAAKELGMSLSTAERLWAYARAWLFRAMRKDLPPVS